MTEIDFKNAGGSTGMGQGLQGARKAERCTVCGHVFSSTANGDRHRKVVEHYDLVRVDGKVRREHLERNEKGKAVVPDGWQLLSEHNQRRECVNPATVDLVQNKRGVWVRAGGGYWKK